MVRRVALDPPMAILLGLHPVCGGVPAVFPFSPTGGNSWCRLNRLPPLSMAGRGAMCQGIHPVGWCLYRISHLFLVWQCSGPFMGVLATVPTHRDYYATLSSASDISTLVRVPIHLCY